MSPSLKILVCYHKPAYLLKSDVLVPIHLGRALATEASKDGAMSLEDYQWMLDNMIGDDTGDNISELNRYFCELTAIYWAWKNYDKLGNPDYIGFCHYRRFFQPKDIEQALNYDITAPYEANDGNLSIKEQFMNFHYCDCLDKACELLVKYKQEYHSVLKKYLEQKGGYFFNMFIMKKDLFFEYCQMLFNVLLPLHEQTDYNQLTLYNQRMPGFLAERLTGMFINCQAKAKKKIQKCHATFRDISVPQTILPVFDKDSVSICFSADDNYAPYLGVCIQSVKANKSVGRNYDVCIFDGGISSENKKKILLMRADDFSIRFIDIKAYLADIDVSIFTLNAHFTLATYYRFFIPLVFARFSKILYLDCDMVVHHNLEELFDTDLNGKAIGAVLDTEMYRCVKTDKQYNGKMISYLTETLGMKDCEKYFQAGLLLMDINKLKDMSFTDKCLTKLIEIGEPKYVDQCVLNALFNGDIHYLDLKWNVEWQIPYYIHYLDRQFDIKMYRDYFASYNNPYIIHYAGGIKPWKAPSQTLADIWWFYARQTPFYEAIIYKQVSNFDGNIVKEIFNYPKNKLRYLRYKLLSKITFGKMRKHYKRKKKELKMRLKEVKKLLNNK